MNYYISFFFFFTSWQYYEWKPEPPTCYPNILTMTYTLSPNALILKQKYEFCVEIIAQSIICLTSKCAWIFKSEMKLFK